MATTNDFLDKFDHVVVLMMENRSFDNLFGHLYDGYPFPLGKTFEGAQGQWNPDHNGKGRFATSLTRDPHEPYPDPGEFFHDVVTQLYGKTYDPACDPDPTSGEPAMNGFVLDYYNVLRDLTENRNPLWRWPFDPGFNSRKIMKCFDPVAIPALATLARDFAVFDHWFCALPSETWPNRAFWHAATSWGFADMPLHDKKWNLLRWLASSDTGTLFSLLDDKFGADANNWCIYSDMPMSATELIHLGSFHGPSKKVAKVHQRPLQYSGGSNFFADCADGKLPKYAFLEPHMFNFMPPEYWHNDMHPSEWMHAWHWMFLAQGGPDSVLLGDHLIWQVYQAIQASQHRDASGRLLQDRTLFIITFDEHGGCFDHVRPPKATPPNLSERQYGFPFERLGVRVPMVMISSHIAPGTIVNDAMHHCSFLKTMQQKWGLGSLGPRQDDAPSFADVTFSDTHRSWPDLSHIYRDHPAIARAKAKPPKLKRNQPLSRLQSLIVAATHVHLCNLGHASHQERPKMTTQGDAQDFFERYGDLLNKTRHAG